MDLDNGARALRTWLGNLQLTEFIYQQPADGDIEHLFRHALIQEVAYNKSLLVERKELLHERMGSAMGVSFTYSNEDPLSELAWHPVRPSGNDPPAGAGRKATQPGATHTRVGDRLELGLGAGRNDCLTAHRRTIYGGYPARQESLRPDPSSPLSECPSIFAAS